MRLINAYSLDIREFHEGSVPRYAILSHTWSEPEDEVTFHDMAMLRQSVSTGLHESGTYSTETEIKQKPGLAKILFACRQAIEDGLEWAWVDTCCIDKTSSAELDESIMSMYRWYEQSTQCYAYLSDVPKDLVGDQLEGKLRASRWFTRCWTLQELIAPRQVTFFGQSWKRLGSRSTHSMVIHDITRVPEKLLRCDPGNPFSNPRHYSAAQKMSWAAGRNCKKKEDVAYCLLGLFGIYMPLQYGEGNQAFVRLQEEILRKTAGGDHSLFAWTATAEDGLFECQMADSIFASSPSDFINSGDIVTFHEELGSPAHITTHGVKVHLPVERGLGSLAQTYPVSYGRPVFRAVLNCGRLALTTERRLSPRNLWAFCSEDQRVVLLLAETRDRYRGLQKPRCYSRLATSQHLGIHDKSQFQDPSCYETIFLDTNSNHLRGPDASLSLHRPMSSYSRFTIMYQTDLVTGNSKDCLPYRVQKAWKFHHETGRWEQRLFSPAKIETFDGPYLQKMEMRGHQLQPLEFWFGFERRRPGLDLVHVCLKTRSRTFPPDKSGLSFILTELEISRTEDDPRTCDVDLRVGSSILAAKVHCESGEMDDILRLRVEFSIRPRLAASHCESGGRELIPITTAPSYADIRSESRVLTSATRTVSDTIPKRGLFETVDGITHKRQRWATK